MTVFSFSNQLDPGQEKLQKIEKLSRSFSNGIIIFNEKTYEYEFIYFNFLVNLLYKIQDHMK
jgi:hypothetical protein